MATTSATGGKRKLPELTEESAIDILQLWSSERPDTMEDDLKEDGFANVPKQEAVVQSLRKRIKTLKDASLVCCEVCEDLNSSICAVDECKANHKICQHCVPDACMKCVSDWCPVCSACIKCNKHCCPSDDDSPVVVQDLVCRACVLKAAFR